MNPINVLSHIPKSFLNRTVLSILYVQDGEHRHRVFFDSGGGADGVIGVGIAALSSMTDMMI